MAGVGMAAGAGLYVIAVGGTVLAIVALELLDRLEKVMKVRTDQPASASDPADADERA